MLLCWDKNWVKNILESLSSPYCYWIIRNICFSLLYHLLTPFSQTAVSFIAVFTSAMKATGCRSTTVLQSFSAVVSPQCRGPAHRSRSSSLSLTVESALESFDFLNTSDFDDEDTGDDHAAVSRSVFFDMEAERIG